jgi:hypothetical protein
LGNAKRISLRCSSAVDSEKYLGGSIDCDDEAKRFAKIIARQEGTDFPKFFRSRVTHDEALANAALIAAAPDLYAALKRIVADYKCYELEEDAVESVRIAEESLAKANPRT